MAMTIEPQAAYETEAVFLDVRETHEHQLEHIDGSVLIPLGGLSETVETAIPNKDEDVIVYCASGIRSATAAAALLGLGYTHVRSLQGGIKAWSAAGLPIEADQSFTTAERNRYSRHFLLDGVGVDGQRKLKDARVLILGLGGLGSPVALYLAAAGIGTLGLVDDDVVELSNLQRQVIHASSRLGELKVESAQAAISDLNPETTVHLHPYRLSADNIMETIGDYDIIVDGVDNFPTRYLLNDASVRLGIPVVSAAILGFEGQISVFAPDGPCYRCLFPSPPPAHLAPTCGDNGVLGVLPGTVGLLQATEVLKLILGIGEPLIGRLMLYDALEATTHVLNVRKDPHCPVCGDNAPTITDETMGVFDDYEAFCAI